MSAEYTYRRKLRATELMPALGAGIGLGLAVFYVVRLLLQRTPVLPPPGPTSGPPGVAAARAPAAVSPGS